MSWSVVGVYVDDLLVKGRSKKQVDEVFKILARLQIKYLGIVKKDLVMIISQASIDEMISKFGPQDAHF